MMLFSDATQLASFGGAKAWPVRVSFGNLSKYERCKPDPQNHYEIAYIPSLPYDIQDQIRTLEGGGRPIPKALLTHLRRELFHAMWKQLLDAEFLRAWRQGVVIHCADGVTRRVFPRIFSYSADYPEKVLLATIRGINSLRPCPRCLMPKSEFANLGLMSDIQRRRRLKRTDSQQRNELIRTARSIIYTGGRAVTSKGVEQLLRPHSYAPTTNAFSSRLRFFGFDIFESLAVDFLHEFELGVWKSVFQHLLRILESTATKLIPLLNERFRLIPAFGRETIRPFREDVSNLTRPAARNYEDILQCIIPPLEGLLPSAIEKPILTLMFVLAQWHGLAKLRRHTSATIEALRHTTTRLGHELREFHRYTSELGVYETAKEHTARQQRIRRKAKPRAALTADSNAEEPAPSASQSGRRRRTFNLETIKLHALGDHVESIEHVGTSDLVSTQTGELVHRHSKRRYARTNGRDYLQQMDRIQWREARLRDIHQNITRSAQSSSTSRTSAIPTTPVCHLAVDDEVPTYDAGRAPYQIAASQKNPILFPVWLDEHRSDPAFKGFALRLKSHILARILGDRYEDELARTALELAQVQFQHEYIYAHQTLKIHYTTYD
ncbi:hypothetical protein FRC06_008826, partial [Ceratobasidium sp. 370]